MAAPFSKILREGGSPKPGDAERYEKALDELLKDGFEVVDAKDEDNG